VPEGVAALLRSDVQADRVRVTDGAAVEPLSVLRSGSVVCSLHHRGAISFLEAV
jgi:hypothetical protein